MPVHLGESTLSAKHRVHTFYDRGGGVFPRRLRRERRSALSAEAYERESGWVTFAAIVMFSVAFFRIISAFAYFNNSSEVANLTAGLFGDTLWMWGLWDLVIAVLALFAGISLLGNNGFGRVLAYIWAVVAIVNSFAIVSSAPWYAALTIGLAVLVVYGLATSPRTEAYS